MSNSVEVKSVNMGGMLDSIMGLANLKNAMTQAQLAGQQQEAQNFKDVLYELPDLINTHGVAAANGYLRRVFPNSKLTENEDGTVKWTSSDGESLDLNPRRIMHGKELFDSEMKVRKMFSAETAGKDEGISAINAIEQLGKKQIELGKQGKANPMTDISLSYLLIRALDPGGRITDKEFDMPGKATGLEGQAVRLYMKALSGERLTQEQRVWLVQLAKDRKATLQTELNPIVNSYKRMGDRWGLNTDNILTPVGGIEVTQIGQRVQIPPAILNAIQNDLDTVKPNTEPKTDPNTTPKKKPGKKVNMEAISKAVESSGGLPKLETPKKEEPKKPKTPKPASGASRINSLLE